MKLPRKGEIVSLAEIKELCMYFGLYELWNKIESDPPPKPFKSDGCSCWPDLWKNKKGKKVDLYEQCCIHDLKYWGSYPNDEIDRLIADTELMVDVAKVTGNIWLAQTMFIGIRAGGGSIWKQDFSFGFGRV